MQAIIYNEKIIIENPIPQAIKVITKAMSYKDKAKEYSVKRMSNNPWSRNSEACKQAKKEIYGCLAKQYNNNIEIPSGFADLVKTWNIPIIDKRTINGDSLSLPWAKQPYDLRDYQAEAVSVMEDNYRGLINMATGLGKTLVAIHVIRKIKKKTLVVCPNTSIASNFHEQLSKAFGDHKVGMFGDNKKQIKPITVGIAASVNNHIDKFKDQNFGLAIFDEVHHLAASTFYNISTNLANIGQVFGLTATDFRNDGKDIMITAGVGPVIIKRDLIWGIKHKWLADPYIIVREVPTDGRQYKNDKRKNYKAHVLECSEMNNQIISDISKFLQAGKHILCLVDQVAHGKMLSDQLGIPLATGADKASRKYVDDLNNNKIQGLIGTDKFIGEGTDTQRVDILIMANFVANRGNLWQNLGRGLRLYGNKQHLIVLDYIPMGSDMLKRHGKQRIALFKEITKKIKIITI